MQPINGSTRIWDLMPDIEYHEIFELCGLTDQSVATCIELAQKRSNERIDAMTENIIWRTTVLTGNMFVDATCYPLTITYEMKPIPNDDPIDFFRLMMGNDTKINSTEPKEIEFKKLLIPVLLFIISGIALIMAKKTHQQQPTINILMATHAALLGVCLTIIVNIHSEFHK